MKTSKLIAITLTAILFSACSSQAPTPEKPLASQTKTTVNISNQKPLCDYFTKTEIESILGSNFETNYSKTSPEFLDCSFTNVSEIQNYMMILRTTTPEDAADGFKESKNQFQSILDPELFTEVQPAQIADQTYGYTSNNASNFVFLKGNKLLTVSAASSKPIANVTDKLNQLATKVLSQ